MELPTGDWDMLFMSDTLGVIQDGRGNTQQYLGEPLQDLIGDSVFHLVSNLDTSCLKNLLESEFAYTQAILKFRTHNKWEELFYTTANKIGLDQPFWVILQQVPPSEGGGVMLSPEKAEARLVVGREFSEKIRNHSKASFFEIGGLDNEELERVHGKEHMENVHRGLVQSIVADGENEVSRLDKGRFAVLHNGNYEEAQISTNVDRSFKQSELEDIGISSQTLEIDPADESLIEQFDRLLNEFECNGIGALTDIRCIKQDRPSVDPGVDPGVAPASDPNRDPAKDNWVRFDKIH